MPALILQLAKLGMLPIRLILNLRKLTVYPINIWIGMIINVMIARNIVQNALTI